jgi:hypothetical protein
MQQHASTWLAGLRVRPSQRDGQAVMVSGAGLPQTTTADSNHCLTRSLIRLRWFCSSRGGRLNKVDDVSRHKAATVSTAFPPPSTVSGLSTRRPPLPKTYQESARQLWPRSGRGRQRVHGQSRRLACCIEGFPIWLAHVRMRP